MRFPAGLVALVICITTPGVAGAQTFFPGSVSSNSGLASPLETDNLVTYYSVEQGFTWMQRGASRVIPFVTLSGSRDRVGFDWNNKIVGQAGLKYSRGFRSGVVQFGAGYAHERRLESGMTEGRPVWFGNYWFGWQGSVPSRRSRTLFSGFPGSSWSVVGTPAPTERAKFFGMWSVEQGVAVVRVMGVTVAPFAEQTLTIDSARLPWNNRYLGGGGLKVRVPVGRGTIELAGSYKHERRWIEHRAASGVTASANLWYGWDPSSTH